MPLSKKDKILNVVVENKNIIINQIRYNSTIKNIRYKINDIDEV